MTREIKPRYNSAIGAMEHHLRIDPEFRDLLGRLETDDRLALADSIAEEGCRDALVAWPQADGDPILLDGHHRHEICEKMGAAYRVVECPDTVTDRQGALAWIVENQRARRNLTPDQIAYLRGKVYQAEKKREGGDGTNQHSEELGNFCPVPPHGRTSAKVASEFGVSERTIRNNAKFANQVDAVAAEHGPEAKAEILAGRKKVADYQTPLYPDLEVIPEITPPPPGEAPPAPPPPPLKRTQQAGHEMIAKLRECAEAILALRDLGLPTGTSDPAVKTTIFHVREALCALERHLNQEPEE